MPTATVLKNLSNLFTIIGDYYLYNKVRLLLAALAWWPELLLALKCYSSCIATPAAVSQAHQGHAAAAACAHVAAAAVLPHQPQ